MGLLLILGTHEFGHYLACRKNDVDSSLPYFIPAPPFFLVGTFGAFIKIKEPIPDRRALMEIGAAGPIAGFVAAVPVLAIGIALSDVYPAMQVPGYNLGDSLITFLFSKAILGVTSYDEAVTIMVHPVAYAGWFGMFITAMNLLPIGQLDRGHVIYSLFPRHHVWVGIVFFVALLIMGWGWPGWFVFSGLILLMGFRHPPLLEDEPDLKRRHLWMGYACILIFLATIIPIPIEVIGG
ncbi:MAG: site-2 protease family protein [Nitrospinaceae bacterium]